MKRVLTELGPTIIWSGIVLMSLWAVACGPLRGQVATAQTASKTLPAKMILGNDVMTYWQLRTQVSQARVAVQAALTTLAAAQAKEAAAKTAYQEFVRKNCEPLVAMDNSLRCPALTIPPAATFVNK